LIKAQAAQFSRFTARDTSLRAHLFQDHLLLLDQTEARLPDVAGALAEPLLDLSA